MTYRRFRLMLGIGAVLVCLPACSSCVQNTCNRECVSHTDFCARYVAAAQYELAEERCDLALEYSGGRHAEAWNLKATIAIGRGQLDLAADYVKHALSQRNEFAEAHNNLGVIMERRGDITAAIDAYSEALELDPGYLQARRNRGYAYRATGAPDKARHDFLKCLEIEPSFCECREGLGVMALARDDIPDARGELRKLTDACPNYAMGHYNLCVANLRAGACDEAVTACVSAIAIDRNCLECQHNLSAAYACVAQNRGIQDVERRAAAADPGNPEPHFRLGVVFEEQHLIADAHDAFVDAVRLSGGAHVRAIYRWARTADALARASEVVDACHLLIDKLRGNELAAERDWCARRALQLQVP